MTIRNYQDLIAWKKGMTLAVSVYRVSTILPREERFGLMAQMRRAAVSIPSNIAEGQGRRTDGEFLNQLSVAHGSIRELETHLQLCKLLGMLKEADVRPVLEEASEVGRLVTGLSNSIAGDRS